MERSEPSEHETREHKVFSYYLFCLKLLFEPIR